jgi:hypothetical protein
MLFKLSFSYFLIFPFVIDMLMMRSQLKTKKRLGGSTSMVMYLDIRSISLCLQQQLALAPSCLPCKFNFKAVLLLVLSHPFFKVILLLSSLLTLLTYVHWQHNFHFRACSSWCLLSL